MTDLLENPLGLDGFEFVEWASPTPGILEPVFEKMGFTKLQSIVLKMQIFIVREISILY
jgi:4-hydroxyphenylpyruvate dioxygenase